MPFFEFFPAVRIGPGYLGAVGLAHSIGGALVCFAAVLVAYHLAQGGAGDVKLAAALGALLGVHHGVLAVTYGYIAAGIAIVAWSIWTHGPVTLLVAFGRKIGSFLLPFVISPPSETEQALLTQPMPLAPFFAIGTLLVFSEPIIV